MSRRAPTGMLSIGRGLLNRPSPANAALVRISSVLHVLPRFNRHYDVLALFLVTLGVAEEDHVLVNPEVNGFTDWKKHRVLRILRAQVIDHSIRLQNVFLAKNHLGVFVRRVGSQDFTRDRLCVFLGISARRRVHGQERTLVIAGRIFCQQSWSSEDYQASASNSHL